MTKKLLDSLVDIGPYGSITIYYCMCTFFYLPADLCFDEFFEKNGVSAEMAKVYTMTMLQKCAKSTCIYKNTLILDRLMKARGNMAYNMYYSKLIYQ